MMLLLLLGRTQPAGPAIGAVLRVLVLILGALYAPGWAGPGWAQQAVLNEVMASNRATLADEEGEFHDWMELFNAGAEPVNLLGWGLSDDPDRPFRWVFPEVMVGPGEYLLVWASGKDRPGTAAEAASTPLTATLFGAPLHTNFRISAGGEKVLLTRPDGERADEAPPVELRSDWSWGRQPDGTGGWRFFPEATPGRSNDTPGYLSVLEPPGFSHSRGLYSEPFGLELSTSEPGAEILYTLDGSDPARGGARLYGGSAVPITGTTVVRAWARKEGHLASATISGSFIFPEQALVQPANPAGFPATWGGSGGQARTDARYKMDPRIVNDPAYAELLRQAWLELPVLSISMDVQDLFGAASGIYSNPDRSGRAWERPAAVEFFTPDGMEQFHVNSGIRIQGGSSTANWKVMKLSLRLFFREEYGSSRLRHRFFPDSPVESFRTLVLGASHNLSWQHPDHGQRVRAQYVRDVFMPDLHRATGALSPHDRFAHLFLNGLYWGLFYVQNRPDATFMAENLGGSREDYDVVRHNGSNVVDGDNRAWNAMMAVARGGLRSLEAYESIQEYLDVPAFIDYMLVNFWAGNTDWPHHNWYAGRKREPGARFLFFSWDAEHVLKSATGDNRTGVNNRNTPGELYDRLRANPEFRLLFADRVHRHFFNDGPLYVDPGSPQWDPANPHRNRPAALYMQRIAEIDAAMALETARWGDTRRPAQPYTRNREWAEELDWLLTRYFPQRSGVVLGQLRNAGLYPQTAAPVMEPPGGAILSQAPIVLSAPSGGAIYYTLDGEDPRVYGQGVVSEAAIRYNGPLTLAGETIVKARVLRNGEWSALNEGRYTLPPLEPHRLAEGPFLFEHWDRDSPAGTYPAHMIFEQTEQRDPGLDTGMSGYWSLPYGLENRSRVNGLGASGISFINTANPQEEGGGYLGAARLALDTTGQTDLWLQWTVGTVTPNSRIYGLRPQYRLGADGAFEDLLDPMGRPLEYLRNELAGHAETFGPVRLPSEIENQPYVELRWKYYHLEGDSGPRAELRLDNIRVQAGFDPTLPATTFAQWRQGQFTATELADPAISGPWADPLQSGLSNLLRYAFGLSLEEPAGPALPRWEKTEQTFEFSFPMDAGRDDLVYQVLASTDLRDWTEVLFDSTATPAPPLEEGRLRLSVPVHPAQAQPAGGRFLKLRVGFAE